MRFDDYGLCFLAGGQARRMGGGDKGEITLDGQTIIAHLIARFSDAPYLFLNANGDSARFAHYGLDVVPDLMADYQGPLCGIYSAMCHLKQTHPAMKWLVVLPTDAPLLPASLIDDLRQAAAQTGAKLVSVKSKGRTHPVIGLWSLSVCDALGRALLEEGVRKIDLFTSAIGCHYVDYDAKQDPFLNLNRPEDVTAYRGLLASN